MGPGTEERPWPECPGASSPTRVGLENQTPRAIPGDYSSHYCWPTPGPVWRWAGVVYLRDARGGREAGLPGGRENSLEGSALRKDSGQALRGAALAATGHLSAAKKPVTCNGPAPDPLQRSWEVKARPKSGEEDRGPEAGPGLTLTL